MSFSLLPVLIVIQFLIISLLALRAKQLGFIDAKGLRYVNLGLICLSIWAVLVGVMAYSGWFSNDIFLRSWPALWLTGIAVLIVEIPMVISKNVKKAINGVIDATPLYYFVAFQGLRVIALGSILKAMSGEFSYYFGMFIGVPDLIFGLSAFILAPLVYMQKIDMKYIAVWNYVGALIIVPTALILMQLGLPSPVQLFYGEPTIATIFSFPMVLAPTVAVPVFVMSNLFVARRIIQYNRAGGREVFQAG